MKKILMNIAKVVGVAAIAYIGLSIFFLEYNRTNKRRHV